MARILIKNLSNREIDLTTCSTSLLHCLLNQGLDWMHACGGKGRCTTCKVKVLSGIENFTPLSPAEIRYRSQNLLQTDERLTCQVRVKDNVVISVPLENQLPHIVYEGPEES